MIDKVDVETDVVQYELPFQFFQQAISDQDAYRRDHLVNLMGELGVSGRILALFSCMDIAEEEIADGKKRYKHRQTSIHDAFRYMKPSELLEPLTLELYRVHARELVDRIGRDEDVNLATDAELLCLFCQGSLAAPLNHDGFVCYQELFRRVFPEKVEMVFPDGEFRKESWEGATEVELAKLRKKFRQDRDIRKHRSRK